MHADFTYIEGLIICPFSFADRVQSESVEICTGALFSHLFGLFLDLEHLEAGMAEI